MKLTRRATCFACGTRHADARELKRVVEAVCANSSGSDQLTLEQCRYRLYHIHALTERMLARVDKEAIRA